MPDAAVSALCLERMPAKEEKEGNVPNEQLPDSKDVGPIEDAETEDDIITDPRDLFRKFEDLVAKDSMNLGTSFNISKTGISAIKGGNNSSMV